MAKLYWRVKKKGKWTWTSAVVRGHYEGPDLVSYIQVEPLQEEEE